MTWQRMARLGVAVALVVFALVLYFAMGRRPTPTPQAVVGRSDPAAVVETASGVLTLANGEVIAFEHQLTYADGRSVLRGVTLTTRDEHGREVVVTARESTQQSPQGESSRLGEVVMKGDVHVTTSDGLDLRTAEATYSDATRMLRSAGRVEFTRDRLSGSGVGATYDRAGDALWLLAAARVQLDADEQGGGALTATAGAAGLERAQHILRLVGNAHIERADRTIDAAEATLRLSDDDKRLTRAELRGGSRVARPAATPGQLSAMQARTIDLDYAEDGTSLRRAQLDGDAADTGIDLAGESGAAGRSVRAARLTIDLAPDGATITALEGRDRVQLTLPASAARPAQTISASALDAEGTAAEGLRSAHFTGGVVYREAGAAPKSPRTVEREARSATLDVQLQARMDGIGSARFQGAVVFTDGAWRGEAPEASYDPAKGILLLSSSKAAREILPRLADDRVTVDGEAIELALDTRRMTADGRVRSVFRPVAAKQTGARAADTRLPPMLDDQQPLYVTAAKLVYDGGVSVATYTGGSRLWQGDSLVRADAITLDDRHGNLTASGAVHSRLSLERSGAGASAKGQERTVGEAKELKYADADRTLAYVGGAHVVGWQGDINAERIELILGQSGRGMAKAEAYDAITAHLEGGYTITGKRLTYLVEEQRYLVQGQPVRVLEQKPDGCKETVGRLLTLEKSTDTITVVGTEGNRSKSLPVPCTERRR